MSRQLLCLAMCLLAYADLARAAQWFIGSVSGSPGTTVTVPVWIYGDGATSDAQIALAFDEARLSLSVASGDIPGAAVGSGAYCVRQASSRIGVMKLSGNGVALPTAWTQVCQIPFAIPGYAAPGKALVTGFEALCAASSGNQSCSITSGVVTVNGAIPPPPLSFASAVLAVLMSSDPSAPTPEQLAAVDYLHGGEIPLAALAEIRPLHVRPLQPQRARGDFLRWILANPDTASARLERYVLVTYETEAAARAGASALADEPLVDNVVPMPISMDVGSGGGKASSADRSKNGANQYHLAAVQAQSAWNRAGGWSLVGVADTGIDTNHPDLRSFIGNTYVGGNYLPVYNYDYSGQGPGGENDANVDERQPVVAPFGADPGCLASAVVCQSEPVTQGVPCMQASFAGHGTHVAGLIASNTVLSASDPSDLQGVCRHCGIAVMKVASTTCAHDENNVFFSSTLFQPAFVPAAVKALAGIGAQVVNLSSVTVLPDGYCGAGGVGGHPWCDALQIIEDNDVILVAASGNHRLPIQFPGNDRRAVAVGGTAQSGASWDRSPGSFTNCPYYNPNYPNAPNAGFECGSNYTQLVTSRHQELVAPAENVRSTFYRGVNWNGQIGCGDVLGDGNINNGDGLCTGTSMSAPIVSGVFGILRSINPLVPKGDPEGSAYGVRDVVTQTTDRTFVNQAWSATLGYGTPNARRAAEMMLGRVRDFILPNRLTPLFTLYSPNGLDFASVASPQSAGAFIRYSDASYTTTANPSSPATPGYSAFRTELAAPTPRANAYVLTTEFASENTPTPVPLYWLDRERPWPAGCSGTPPACYPYHHDSLLVSTVADVQAAVAQGYRFRGRQGYIYPRCAADACMPAGTERMYRYCNAANDDCAIFLQNQLAAYQSLGYTSIFPAGSDPVMGYAYPNVDSDGDWLVNGMEQIMGTGLNDQDSDNDGVSDGVEFPQAGIAASDPCSAPMSSPNNGCTRPMDALHTNGFE